jgi:NADH-ubiquinone oxidoreductase chain 6
MNNILLDLLTFTSVLSAILVITARSPVISVLFLIAVFINIAGYLILLGVNFIALSYIMVYIGAIAILFLFVIMMLNVRLTELHEIGSDYSKNFPLAIVVAASLSYIILSNSLTKSIDQIYLITALFDKLNFLNSGINTTTDNYINIGYNTIYNNIFVNYEQIQAIGNIMYSSYGLYLILCSFVLLLAMLGPIIITLDKKSNTPRKKFIKINPFKYQIRNYHVSYLLRKEISKENFPEDIDFKTWLITAPEGKPVKIYLNSKESKTLIYAENKRKSGIYLIFNNINNKYYIGSAKDIKIRLSKYFSPLYLIKNNYLIQRAIIKHGYENLSIYILEYCEVEDLISREQYYINLLTPQYNILTIAGSPLGRKHSEEAKARMSASTKGMKHSEKTKAQISLTKTGVQMSEETRLKLINRKITEETRAKMSIAQKGRLITEVHKEKLRKPKTEEVKARMSASARKNPVFVYASDSPTILFLSFESNTKAAKYFDCNIRTISRNLDTNKPFRGKWLLSSTNIDFMNETI